MFKNKQQESNLISLTNIVSRLSDIVLEQGKTLEVYGKCISTLQNKAMEGGK